MLSRKTSQYIRTCPNCKNEGYLYLSDHPYSERFICEHCGNFYDLTMIRDVTDVDNDLGKYKFISCLDPWGFVQIIRDDGSIEKNAVSKEMSDNFLDWVNHNSHNIKSITRSYMETNKQIKVINIFTNGKY